MAIVEGIAVSGEYVEKLADKRFAVGAKPHYEEIPSIDDPNERVRRLVMTIVMYHDRSVLEYYPNKTSIKTMANLWGYEMDHWVGKIFEWETLAQKVRGMNKMVLFVKNKKIDEIFVKENTSFKAE